MIDAAIVERALNNASEENGQSPTGKLRSILKILQDGRTQENYLADICQVDANTLLAPNYFSRWQTSVIPSIQNLDVLLR